MDTITRSILYLRAYAVVIAITILVPNSHAQDAGVIHCRSSYGPLNDFDRSGIFKLTTDKIFKWDSDRLAFIDLCSVKNSFMENPRSSLENSICRIQPHMVTVEWRGSAVVDTKWGRTKNLITERVSVDRTTGRIWIALKYEFIDVGQQSDHPYLSEGQCAVGPDPSLAKPKF